MSKLKIVWYNVLRGFHKKELDGSFTFEQKRFFAVKKIIKSLNPDFLFIGEGDFNPRCKIKGEKVKIIDYKKEFGFPYFYYSKPDKTSRKGEVILSKISFKVKNFSKGDYSNENYTDLKCFFKLNKKEILVEIIHPYPTIPEKEKANFVKKILKGKKENYLLLGDFNALSPDDKYEKENLFKLFSLMAKNKMSAWKNVHDSSKSLMIKEVLKSGLKDTFKEKNKKQEITLPTKNYSPFKNKKAGIRLDYIFCSKNFEVLKSKIIKNKLTDIASDHYPIYAELDIK